MKAWQITDANKIEQIKRNESVDFNKELKVKITKAMISPDDITLFNGDDKPTYPLIPGRFAIGVVVEVEPNPYGFEKNTRVFLDPITNCKSCYSCTIGQPKDCSKFNIAGINAEGFLKGLDGSLSEAEIRALPMGAYVITLETGIRFLTDYLEGDTYFRIHREGHNLDRARNQFKLVADMEEKMDRLNAIVAEFVK